MEQIPDQRQKVIPSHEWANGPSDDGDHVDAMVFMSCNIQIMYCCYSNDFKASTFYFCNAMW